VEALESKCEGHDKKLHEVFQMLRELLNVPKSTKRPIGIRQKTEDQ
jgi:hypothetical protein